MKLLKRIFIQLSLIGMLVFIFFTKAYAILTLELTQGISSAIPIAVVPFKNAENCPQNISNIIATDLQNSGQFKVLAKDQLNQFPAKASSISPSYFKNQGIEHVLVGSCEGSGSHYIVQAELVDVYGDSGKNAKQLLFSKNYSIDAGQLRAVAHHVSDVVYEKILGVRGVFSTKIAYVVVQRSGRFAQYRLEVSDQDGYNPRPLLTSSEPIMSPAWSPDGKSIAYVSFENHQSAIFIQDLRTGSRRLLSMADGINGAPTWSPDGRQLALVLSKSGSPNIYVIPVSGGAPRAVTRDFYINTEPSFAPDGHSLLFTSDRGGGPQIYRISLNGGSPSRVSFDGAYNARASYTSDGKQIVMIHRVSGVYKIALLNLNTGNVRVISSAARDSASPSVAPNASMILFDTYESGKNMLAMVSSDGRVQLRLPARSGDAQDPAWSPFGA